MVQWLGLQASIAGGQSLIPDWGTCSSIFAWKIPQRSLAGYSPWGRRELDTTEHSTLGNEHSTSRTAWPKKQIGENPRVSQQMEKRLSYIAVTSSPEFQ